MLYILTFNAQLIKTNIFHAIRGSKFKINLINNLLKTFKITISQNISLQWLKYIQHLKVHYPYLFVTVLIKNPYDFRSSEEIEREVLKKLLKDKKIDRLIN